MPFMKNLFVSASICFQNRPDDLSSSRIHEYMETEQLSEQLSPPLVFVAVLPYIWQKYHTRNRDQTVLGAKLGRLNSQ